MLPHASCICHRKHLHQFCRVGSVRSGEQGARQNAVETLRKLGESGWLRSRAIRECNQVTIHVQTAPIIPRVSGTVQVWNHQLHRLSGDVAKREQEVVGMTSSPNSMPGRTP